MNGRIKKLRKDLLGLTLDKFGEHLGVKKSTLSNIESGRSAVTEQMFKSICREFNVNEEWLRDGIGEPFDFPEDETAAIVADLLEVTDNHFYDLILEIVRTYQNLQPTSQDVIKDFCRQIAENTKKRKE